MEYMVARVKASLALVVAAKQKPNLKGIGTQVQVLDMNISSLRILDSTVLSALPMEATKRNINTGLQQVLVMTIQAINQDFISPSMWVYKFTS